MNQIIFLKMFQLQFKKLPTNLHYLMYVTYGIRRCIPETLKT